MGFCKKEVQASLDNDEILLKIGSRAGLKNGKSVELDVPAQIRGRKMTAVEAYDTYMKKYPNTKVYEIELEEKNGRYVYEVDGFDSQYKYELKIDVETGRILKDERELLKESKTALDRKYVISADQLIKDRLADVGKGLKLSNISIEIEKGIPELEIEFKENGKKVEYEYNLETGQRI